MRVLSGIQPSGDLHIGNYFGAIRQHVALQERYDETIYFCADYHSMTSTRSREDRGVFTRELAAGYLACGIDATRSVLYRQSDLPETCELAWLLGTVAPLGLLQRGHAYKDKVAKGEKADFGLFAYPVLMAADILQFAADLVPVGRDQKQHVEFARDIAQSFNYTYGEVLKLPEASILDDVAVVPGIDGEKMSKAYGNVIPLFASDKQTRKAVMAIVTDSTPVEEPKKTDTPLFALWRLFASDEEREEMFARARAGGLGYGEVKKDLLARLLAYFAEIRERYALLVAKPDELEDVLRDGARRARELAEPVFAATREAAGLGPPR
jgi:tryptophanyl-tRNA synthetase